MLLYVVSVSLFDFPQCVSLSLLFTGMKIESVYIHIYTFIHAHTHASAVLREMGPNGKSEAGTAPADCGWCAVVVKCNLRDYIYTRIYAQWGKTRCRIYSLSLPQLHAVMIYTTLARNI